MWMLKDNLAAVGFGDICSVNFSSQLSPLETGYPRLWCVCSLVLALEGSLWCLPPSALPNTTLISIPPLLGCQYLSQGARGAFIYPCGSSPHFPGPCLCQVTALPSPPPHSTELGIWQRSKGDAAAVAWWRTSGMWERRTAFCGDWWLFCSSAHLAELHCASRGRGVTSALAARIDKCSPLGHSSLFPS